MSMNHRLPVDYPIMTWGIILLEVFEVLAIFVIFFALWKLWKFVSPLKRLIGLLKEWDTLLTKHEITKEKKQRIITDLRKELRTIKSSK
jgi:hypothetical protein